MSHTPGPWKMEKSSDGKCIVVSGENAKDYFIDVRCEVDSDDKEPGTALANALLITASPGLLASCKDMLMWLEGEKRSECKASTFTELCDTARAVIEQTEAP